MNTEKEKGIRNKKRLLMMKKKNSNNIQNSINIEIYEKYNDIYSGFNDNQKFTYEFVKDKSTTTITKTPISTKYDSHQRASKRVTNNTKEQNEDNIKQNEMKTIAYYLRDIPKIKQYPIKLICRWHIKNSCSDLDNKSIKSVLDIMQKMGILENDNIKHITKIEYEAIKDEREYLEMEIIENE